MVCFVRELNYTYTRYALGYPSKTKEQNNTIHTCLIKPSNSIQQIHI